MTRILIPVLLVLLSACSQRERLNPLDPENPETGGRLVGLRLDARGDSLQLRWQPMELNDLSHYELQRSRNDSDFLPLADLLPGVTDYWDSNLSFDELYSYRGRAVTDYGVSEWSESVDIVPGPYNLWVADYYDFRVSKLSYDSRRVLGQETFTTPVAIATGPDSSRFYIAEYWNRRLVVVDQGLNIVDIVSLSGNPVDMVMDAPLQRINVLLSNNQIERVQLTNSNRILIPLPLEITTASQLVYDRVNTSLWITNGVSDSLVKVDVEAQPPSVELVMGINRPRRLTADPRLGGVWAASDSGLIQIQDNAIVQTYASDRWIADVAINPLNSDVYFVGQAHADPDDWSTCIISEFGACTQVLNSDYPDLYRILPIPSGGRNGFLAVQLYTWRILRFSGDATLIGEQPGFNGILDFTLE